MKINDIIQFGKYNWRILDMQEDRVLIITQDIIEIRLFDLFFAGDVWETCTLREYLNEEFLSEFTPTEQECILETQISNPDNPWFGTYGGDDTYDKIFLLNIDEAYKYFGGEDDISNFKNELIGNGDLFSDSNNSERQAKYNGDFAFWWLRSPGSQCDSREYDFNDIDTGYAAFVSDDGSIGLVGLDLFGFVDVGGIGIRPALWLKK